MTVYQCPGCGKGIVVEDPEPPGVLHHCDDCGERMESDNSSETVRESDGGER